MLSFPKLETARLIVHPLSYNDAESIQLIASARQIADTTISIPHPYPDGEAERYTIKKITEFQTGKSAAFAIKAKLEAKLMGVIEIRDIDREHSVAELSFWLAPQFWGQGYMSEAVQPILDYGFTHLSLNRIYAFHMARNPASGKVLQKNGFQPEGLLRQRVRKWDVFEDVVLLSILHRDWQEQTMQVA